MADLELGFLLPLPGWPRAVFEGDYGFTGGRLVLDGVEILRAHTRAVLEAGVRGRLPERPATIEMRLRAADGGASRIDVLVDDAPATPEETLRARPSRSAWVHACLALAASAAGFVASWLYLQRAAHEQGDWALKMANHMAGWHLLLTWTLFPASVWGQRIGIRLVQIVSLLFFFIHAGIAIANVGATEGGHSGAIAAFNAASGVFFLAAAIYGNRAHRDMDPVAALRAGRVR
jgi:hypothetical protein